MKKHLGKLFSIIISATLLFPSTITALTPEQRSLFRNSGIIFYDPDGYDSADFCTPNAQTTPDGRPGQPSGTVSASHTAAFMDRWHDTAVRLQILYGIPWEGAMAQGALESGWGRDEYAITKKAFFNVNAVNSNPDAGYSYATPELSWYGQDDPASYAEWIRDNPRYRNHGAFDHVSDPLGYVAAISRAGYAAPDDFDDRIAAGKSPEEIGYEHYYPTLENIITAIIQPYAKQQGWDSSADVTAANPEAAQNAENNAQGATSDGDVTSPLDPCLPGGTIPGSNTDGLPFDLDGSNDAHTTACWLYYPNGTSHAGIDFSLTAGSPIYAAMPGTVRWVGRDNNMPDGYLKGGGFGYYISITHQDGTVAYYGHLQDNSAVVTVGQKVSKGQFIARAGSTGNSTGSHLHYEVRDNGVPIDPRAYLGDFSSIDSQGCSK